MPKPNLNPDILAAAVQGLEAQKARLDAHIAEVKRMLGAQSQQPAPAAAPKRKRRMSAAARRHIVEAQRKRWAEFYRRQATTAQKTKQPAAATKTPGPNGR